MDTMERLLARLGDDEDDTPAKPRPCHEAQIMELEQAARDYAAGAGRFKIGDLVTPKTNTGIVGAGEPRIVVALRPDTDHDMSHDESTEPGAQIFGARWDIRTVAIHNTRDHDIAAHWCESWQLEPYKSA